MKIWGTLPRGFVSIASGRATRLRFEASGFWPVSGILSVLSPGRRDNFSRFVIGEKFSARVCDKFRRAGTRHPGHP